MWNDPLVKPPTAKKPSTVKPTAKKPVKKKPKPRPKSTTKLEKEVAALKELTKAQGITLKRLNEIVSAIQLEKINDL